MDGVQQRGYSIISAKADCQSVKLRMYFTWISQANKEYVKRYISDESRVLAPYGVVCVTLEVSVYRYDLGQFELLSASVQLNTPCSERKMRICAVSSNINYYDGMPLTCAERMDYHPHCVDMLGPSNPDMILQTVNFFRHVLIQI